MTARRRAMALGAASCAALAAFEGGAAATMDCRFDTQVVPGGTFPADWPMRMTDSPARIKVGGSGAWRGRVERLGPAGAFAQFETEASRETISVSDDGTAAWTIAFDDGMSIAYTGRCAPWTED